MLAEIDTQRDRIDILKNSFPAVMSHKAVIDASRHVPLSARRYEIKIDGEAAAAAGACARGAKGLIVLSFCGVAASVPRDLLVKNPF
jgi:hypothetical protein